MNEPQFFTPEGYGDMLRENFHFMQAVRVGDRVETSGQGGWFSDFSFPETIREEIVNAFTNLGRVLELSNASWKDVIHINSYHVPMSDEALAVMTEQFRLHMPDRPPIWTCLGVPALGNPNMRIEIRATAILKG
ncbi:Rid family hydrolase [Variovorax sp. J31P207]|uniref:Rid family hydrolase n=1 Tax=Variovorax sp. J31P207 TaxID=3053510 RepID=UPI0025766655|nr:Rid family hydrolase [Variovorax sp. J31P207]MDM0071530.1 Rid family hydrolase [Variovorax sp. J31P207]